ncbi:uncharacterized protein [Diabrotica undecimpunctata]|uniref:uncharacterized protein n=1 Tax=Diabrotica undecimpunctata TaxID=50387 RepID=UPI003B63794A
MDIRVINYDPQGVIKVKLDHSSSEFTELPIRSKKYPPIENYPPLYTQRCKIPKSKWQNLQELKSEAEGNVLIELSKVQERVAALTGSRESMRMEFHKLGFRWKKTVDNRKMLIEKHEIRHLRLQYLRNIKEARNANKFIVFTDETYLLTSHIAKNNWCDTSNNGLKKPVSKGQRLIIVGAGNEQGFVPGSYVRWKSTSKSGDYHDDMNYANFKKWLEENLLCNLPPNSVIVLDNAPYHNTQEDKCPTSASKKCVMQEWLRERNIAYTASMLKPDLYNIIKLHKPRYIKYAIDRIIRAQGHDVFRLPPYHPDLNPIEMVWAALKSYVGARNVDFTFTSIQQLSDEFFETFPVEEWKKITDKVIATERELMSKEPLIDVVVDRIVINPDEDSDSDDLQLNSDSENSELDI